MKVLVFNIEEEPKVDAVGNIIGADIRDQIAIPADQIQEVAKRLTLNPDGTPVEACVVNGHRVAHTSKDVLNCLVSAEHGTGIVQVPTRGR